jgi:superfamily II DNA or RNA helicase
MVKTALKTQEEKQEETLFDDTIPEGIDPQRCIELEHRENRMIIYCPSQIAVDQVKTFLTFNRTCAKIDRNSKSGFQFHATPEPCYKATNLWNAISCPAGFEYLLIKKFRSVYDFKISKRPNPRLEQNCKPDWSRLDPNVQFRAKQREILETMLAAERGRIVVPTAVGKSFLIQQYVTLLPKARILVCTYSNQVLHQLFTDINRALHGRAGLCCGEKKWHTDARVVCVSQGLLHSYFRENGEQDIDVTIIDEYHEHGSAKRLKVLERIQSSKMFGLSANKTRNDRAEFRLNGLFGPVLAEMQYEEAVEKNLVTPIWVIWTPVQSNTDPTSYAYSYAEREKLGIWRYEKRNRTIAEAARLFNEEDQVLISVKTIDHALHLHKLLPEYAVVYATTDNKQLSRFHCLELLKGLPPMTNERLRILKSKFSKGTLKKAIATSVWSRGVNFPELSVLIRADGANSCIADTQWPGRTSRKHEGKDVSLIIDFTDEFNESFHNKAIDRRNRYSKNGWTQISLKRLKQLMKTMNKNDEHRQNKPREALKATFARLYDIIQRNRGIPDHFADHPGFDRVSGDSERTVWDKILSATIRYNVDSLGYVYFAMKRIGNTRNTTELYPEMLLSKELLERYVHAQDNEYENVRIRWKSQKIQLDTEIQKLDTIPGFNDSTPRQKNQFVLLSNYPHFSDLFLFNQAVINDLPAVYKQVRGDALFQYSLFPTVYDELLEDRERITELLLQNI